MQKHFFCLFAYLSGLHSQWGQSLFVATYIIHMYVYYIAYSYHSSWWFSHFKCTQYMNKMKYNVWSCKCKKIQCNFIQISTLWNALNVITTDKALSFYNLIVNCLWNGRLQSPNLLLGNIYHIVLSFYQIISKKFWESQCTSNQCSSRPNQGYWIKDKIRSKCICISCDTLCQTSNRGIKIQKT